MEKVISPAYSVVYNGKDITADLTRYLISLTYTDKVESSSDEISISLFDNAGLWRNQWLPAKGDTITAELGYFSDMLPAGTFTVDEVVLSGPPDQVEIRAMAAPITKALRTKTSYAHEEKTLKQIAQAIATKHGFTLSGVFPDNIILARSTQYRETDLSYLRRISQQFGYVFSVRGDLMTFSSIYDLENTTAAGVISRNDLSQYTITDQANSAYKSAVAKYRNPTNNKTITGAADGEGETAADTLELRVKAENQNQAEAIAKAVLHRANTRRQVISATTEGKLFLVAGNNIELTGMGRLSGKYHILSSTHTVTPQNGYSTTFEGKKTDEIDISKW